MRSVRIFDCGLILLAILFSYANIAIAQQTIYSNEAVKLSVAAVNSTTIQLRIDSFVSSGYVAIGFGTKMPNSEIYVLWKNSDNSITLSKRSSTDYIQPLADAIQNYQIISNGTGVNSTTNAPYVTFSRPMSLTSANSNGNGIYANLSSPSQSLIWATSTTPPSSSLLNATLAQHGTSGRAVAGVFTLYNTSNSNNNTGGGAMGGRVSFSGASMTTLLSLVAVGVSLFL